MKRQHSTILFWWNANESTKKMAGSANGISAEPARVVHFKPLLDNEVAEVGEVLFVYDGFDLQAL
ncbi:hypothetical protein DSLASN_24800 [Desulfoluna limicola]|uniref:Uncharacterized protein n=1 Tax=Desulfoluna limicola TaxID=2810562 RepID=A0ABM7PHM0_9BACT|nr:hypothetical protein DSLASN_24800 [Desulfoluna limicola]